MNKKRFLIFLGIFSIALFLLIRLMPRVEEVRPYRAPFQKEALDVLNNLDHGKGSLRGVIAEVNTTQVPVSIRFKTQGPIVLETPLPPLLNDGTKVEGPAVIDASLIQNEIFVWTVKGANQHLSGLTIRGKGNRGILFLSYKGSIERCRFEGFDTAVTLGGNFAMVKNSVFEGNKRGVEVMEGAQFVNIFSNEMRKNTEAGIWSVWPMNITGRTALLKIEKNNISGSSTGLVLSIDRGDVRGNVITGNTTGILLLNAGDINIRQNDIYQNLQYGIVMTDSMKSQVTENKIYQNSISGIMMKGSPGNLVQGNSVFSNGVYGVAEILTNMRTQFAPNRIQDNLISDNGDGIYIMASSPIIKGNTVKGNRLSGIKMAYYNKGGKRYEPLPRIEDGDGIADPIVRQKE